MPLIKGGLYMRTDDTPFEAESCYYLNFQVVSALAAIEYITVSQPQLLSVFENECQYYHYHTDHLLYSIGQISTRFLISERADKKSVQERKRINRNNFQFSPDDFPILSDKRCRNTIEHIDESNQKIIETQKGVGGFNLINENTSPDLIEILRAQRTTHPYTLDLLKREILITRNGDELLSINLNSLKEELLRLLSNIKYFKKISSDPFR